MLRSKDQDGGELAGDESPVSVGPTDAHSLGQSWKDHEVGWLASAQRIALAGSRSGVDLPTRKSAPSRIT